VATSLALGLVTLIGALALIVDAGAWRAAHGLGSRLTGAETVVVWSHGLESADAAAARAGEILAGVPGVNGVTPLDPAPGDGLVARMLGAPVVEDGDVRLLAIDAKGGGKVLTTRLTQTLSAQGLPARAADHSWKDSAGARKAGLLAVAAVLAPLIAILAFALVCAFEAKREMKREHGAIELMHISGAADAYLAGLVRARVAGLALTASLWGAAGGLVAAALLSREGVASVLGGLGRADLISPWPLIVVAVWLAGVTGAWLAARSRLKATP
jgi:cell division transport system permease protein